jgi:hypothetical protein
MIISHDYKFIFIKTNKTAGTSIEIALSKFCGPDDIITPIALEDEEIRCSLSYRGPQNYLESLPDDTHNEKRKLKYYNHISAKEIRRLIGRTVWDNYYKFCFERNPWDRLISMYYWRCRTEPRPTITEFLESEFPPRLKRMGYDLYTIDGGVAVDKICRFENLHEELETIRNQLGIPEKLELPRAKSSYRKDTRNYREILNDIEKEKIAELFFEEINLFGYSF